MARVRAQVRSRCVPFPTRPVAFLGFLTALTALVAGAVPHPFG